MRSTGWPAVGPAHTRVLLHSARQSQKNISRDMSRARSSGAPPTSFKALLRRYSGAIKALFRSVAQLKRALQVRLQLLFFPSLYFRAQLGPPLRLFPLRAKKDSFVSPKKRMKKNGIQKFLTARHISGASQEDVTDSYKKIWALKRKLPPPRYFLLKEDSSAAAHFYSFSILFYFIYFKQKMRGLQHFFCPLYYFIYFFVSADCRRRGCGTCKFAGGCSAAGKKTKTAKKNQYLQKKLGHQQPQLVTLKKNWHIARLRRMRVQRMW